MKVTRENEDSRFVRRPGRGMILRKQRVGIANLILARSSYSSFGSEVETA